MRALSVAARVAAAAGVIVLGASCRPDRLTAPGAAGADGTQIPELGTTWGSAHIDVKPDVATVPLGSNIQLTANVGDPRLVTTVVQWSSLDSNVVSVNGAGVATARGAGTARIVGKSGSATDTARVAVTVSVVSVVTSPSSGTLTVGQQSQLGATANDALGHPIADATILWTSANAAVATVSASGLVTGKSTGDAPIIASASGKSDTTMVHVTAVPVASVSIAPGSLALSVGATSQLTASAKDASGATLSDRLTTWSSSNEAVARVSATGQVSAVAAGSATIGATIDGRSASVSVTVSPAPVASVVVTANATSLIVGQTTQVTATARDAAGSPLAGRAVTWSTSNSAVATVSSAGVVTAVAPGSASIVATSEGVKGEIAVSVAQAAVASVTVNLNAGSLAVGQTAQATATALDASGTALSGRAVTWTIAPTSVATVSSGGVVTAVAAGSATLTATVEGKSASVTVTVTAPVVVTQPPPSGALAVMPELPRAVVATATSATPSNGASIRVPAGGDLQGAIDQAKPGDVILLAPGASYTGNFVLRAKSGAGDAAWITIRTETTLPAEGTRVTPTTAASFAKLLTPNASPVIATDPAASYYRISGVAIAPGATSTLAYGLVAFGDAGPAQNTLASVPHHLIVDRSYIHSSATFNLRRCVAVHSAWTAVVDSWLADCHSNDGDSQAIWGSNGPGPFTIVNNYLEGAGENVMFGGADSRAPALLPADITLRRNHIAKPASWLGVWTVKNLFELKVGQRVLVEGNLLEGAWVSGQIGFAILLKSSDQDNTAPWSTTQDVTLRLNRISRAAAGISVMGTIAGDLVTNSTARVLVEHNLIDPVGDPALGGVGRLFQSGATTPPRDVVYRHNTGFGTNAGFIFTEGSQPGFVFLDNVVNGHPDYQWSFSSSDGHGVATAALDYHAPGWKVAGNVIVGGGVQVRPPDNFFPATMGEVGFTDAGGAIGTSFTPGDYRLTAGSPYKGKATDGTDPGVDFGRLSTALAGVRVQP